MKFDVFTLFPQMIASYLEESIIKRAIQNELISVNLHNIRDWAIDKHHVTDDTPYGGGGGMVMKPEPIFAAVEDIMGSPPAYPLILLTPQGKPFDQKMAAGYSKYPKIGLLCGRYEGIDERVREHLVTEEVSIGDFVLTGGELPALMMIDAIARLIPGVLGAPGGAVNDSHASGLIEYPHYTRPEVFRDWSVPQVLLSGNHKEINRWRREQSLRRTYERRPDLLETFELTVADRKYLSQIRSKNQNQ